MGLVLSRRMAAIVGKSYRVQGSGLHALSMCLPMSGFLLQMFLSGASRIRGEDALGEQAPRHAQAAGRGIV